MLKRTAAVVALAVVLLTAGVPLAFGWSNGPHDGDHFGTHDWIITHAANLVGDSASWFDVKEACLASEEPDFVRTSGFLHTFRPTGRSQGAPQEVANLYYSAVKAYQAGNYKYASHQFGVMSHYYTDILQPMHTNTFTEAQATIHKQYEWDAGIRTRHPWYSPLWSVPVGRVPVHDVRTKTVWAALYSRSKASSLIYALRHGQKVTGYTINKITQQCLSRGVNDLADILKTLPSGEGTSAAPTRIATRMTKRRVVLGTKVGLYTRCLDKNGNPMWAARVIFVWPTKTGTKKVVRYTDAAGWVHDYYKVSGLRAGKVYRVKAYSSSSGKTTTISEWFIPKH